MSVRAHLLLDWDHFIHPAHNPSGVRVSLAHWRQRHPRVHLTLITSQPTPPIEERQAAIADSWICGSGASIFLKTHEGSLQIDANHQEVMEAFPSQADSASPLDELLAMDVVYLSTQDLTPRPRLIAAPPDRFPSLRSISDYSVAWPSGSVPRLLRGLDVALAALDPHVRGVVKGISEPMFVMGGG